MAIKQKEKTIILTNQNQPKCKNRLSCLGQSIQPIVFKFFTSITFCPMKKCYTLFFSLFIMLAAGLQGFARTEEPVLLYPFTDNVEWHNDFAISNIEGWIMKDLDGLIPAGPFQDYPNKNQPQAFIVYNPSKTDPPNTFPEFQPRSGDKVFMSISSNSGPSNNWMITRELAPHPGGQFSFYARGTFDFFGNEQFKVGYSMTGSEPGDFIFFNSGNPINAAFVWTRYQYAIPANAKHIAIVGVSYAYCFMVDDIEFKTTVPGLAPGPISGFEAQAQFGEQLVVQMDWTNPEVTSNGNPLADLTGIKVFRATHPMNFQPLTDLGDQGIGEAASFTDHTIETLGFYAYRLVPFNSVGEGEPFTSDFLFLDYETTPGAPHTITFSQNESLQTVISWNEVTYGINGGPLEDPVVGYTLTRTSGNQTITLAENDPSTTFVEAEIPDFNLYTYSITAHTGEGTVGEAGQRHYYSGMSASQQPLTWGKYESEQVFELTRSSMLSQSIYYADQMGSTGLITGLSYFSNLGSHGGSNHYKIYMSTTHRQVFGNTTATAVWEYFGNQKLVYDGPITFEAGPRAIELALDQPFFYDAESGQNVIITLVKPLTTNLPSVTNRVFYNTQIEGVRTYYAIGYGIDMSTITTQPASWATEDVVTIPSIVTTKVEDFGLVSGNVFVEGTTTALEGVSVTATPDPDNENLLQFESTVTDQNGDFLIPALLPGVYEFSFFKEGYNNYTVSFFVDAGTHIEMEVGLSLADPVMISGTVVNQAGTPIEGAYVNLGGYSNYNTMTDESGAFSLQAFAGKDYEMEIIHPLYFTHQQSFVSQDQDYSLGQITLEVAPHKPMNVVASIVDDIGQLSWEVPYGLDHESWLAWGTQTNVNNGWGYGGDPFIAGIRFTQNDLLNLVPENGKLTHVKVYFNNHANFNIKVFEGANAGSLIYSENRSVAAEDWYVFELSEAIPIDITQELWIGIEFLPGYGAYPIGIDEGPNAPAQKGSMLYANGTWTPMSLTNKNWNIYGIVNTTVEANPMGYKVFRGMADAPEASWDELTTSLLAQPSFEDTTIEQAEPGIYRYGVVAKYGTEVFSEMSLSNTVQHHMMFDVGIALQPNAPVYTQAFLRLHNDTHYYELHLDHSQGPAAFSEVWRGTYTLEVQLDYFEPVSLGNLTIEQAQTIDVPMEELRVKPSDLKAVLGEDESTATLTWGLHGQYLDNFEAYPDFERNNIGPYILRDMDGLPTYTYTNFSWPGAGNPMSFMVFNPWATIPPITLPAWSGRRYLVAMAGPSGVNNDWLIIPAGPGTFSFMASSLVSSYPETFNVLYSSTNNQTASFSPLPQGTGIVPPANWTNFTFEAPENTRFLALQYVGNDTYFLLIDDLEYPRRYLHALSYNIYLNGALVDQGIDELIYDLSGLAGGTNLVEVEAVYHSGLSERAQVEIQTTVNVEENLPEAGLKVFPNPAKSHIRVYSDNPVLAISIIDITGKVMLEKQGLNTTEYQIGISGLNEGIYFVRVTTSQGVKVQRLQVLK